MAKRSHFCNHAACLNITPKPTMLQISFLAQTFQSLWLRKKINFTAFYESLTAISHTKRTLPWDLISELPEKSLGCPAHLILSRLIYNLFLFNY